MEEGLAAVFSHLCAAQFSCEDLACKLNWAVETSRHLGEIGVDEAYKKPKSFLFILYKNTYIIL